MEAVGLAGHNTVPVVVLEVRVRSHQVGKVYENRTHVTVVVVVVDVVVVSVAAVMITLVMVAVEVVVTVGCRNVEQKELAPTDRVLNCCQIPTLTESESMKQLTGSSIYEVHYLHCRLYEVSNSIPKPLGLASVPARSA
jgi:hypothetical protein